MTFYDSYWCFFASSLWHEFIQVFLCPMRFYWRHFRSLIVLCPSRRVIASPPPISPQEVPKHISTFESEIHCSIMISFEAFSLKIILLHLVKMLVSIYKIFLSKIRGKRNWKRKHQYTSNDLPEVWTVYTVFSQAFYWCPAKQQCNRKSTGHKSQEKGKKEEKMDH